MPIKVAAENALEWEASINYTQLDRDATEIEKRLTGLSKLPIGFDTTSIMKAYQDSLDRQEAATKRTQEYQKQLADERVAGYNRAIEKAKEFQLVMDKETGLVKYRGNTQDNDSNTGAATYQQGLADLNKTGPVTPSINLNDLKTQLAEVQQAKIQLQQFADAGKLSTGELSASLDILNKKEGELAEAILNHGRAAEVETAATGNQNKAVLEQIGLIEKLQFELNDLKKSKPGLVDAVDIEKSNAKIQDLERELVKLNNIGKTGYDDLGNKITTVEGKINRLNKIASEYKGLAGASDDISKISVFNSKAEQAADAAKKLSNAGKEGFDELGNVIAKNTSFIGNAYNKLRELANFLPGIGVAGIVAFAAGPIIDYISKLDIFGDRLTLAIQRLREQINVQNTLNSVQLEAAKNASQEIEKLNELYAATQNRKISIEENTAAAITLQNLYPTTLGNLSTEAILAGRGADAYKRLKNEISDLAEVKAIADRKSQNADRALSDELKKRDEDRLQSRESKLISDYAKKVTTPGGADVTDKERDDVIQAKKEIEESKKRVSGIITDLSLLTTQNNALDDIQKQLVAKNGVKILNGGKNPIDENAKNALESQKIQVQSDLDAQNDISGNRVKAMDARKAALQKALDDQKQIIALNLKEELLNTNLSESAKKVIRDKANAANVKAENDYQKQLDQLDNKSSRSGAIDSTQYEGALAKRKDILEKISAADSEAVAKSKTHDEQEIEQNTLKFAQLRNQVIAFNTWAQNYNQTHTKKIDLVDVTSIEPARQKAEQNILAQQEVERTKITVGQQKAVYQDYEKFRMQVGDTIANKVYGGEFTAIAKYQTYIDYLKGSLKQLDGKDDSFSNKQKDLYNKELQAANSEQQKNELINFTKLLAQTSTYEDKRLALENIYQVNHKKLINVGAIEQAQQLSLQHQSELESLEVSKSQQISVIQKFVGNVVELTKTQANAQIAALQDIFDKSPELNQQQKLDIITQISALKNALNTNEGLSNKYLTDLQHQKEQLIAQLQPLTEGTAAWKNKEDEIAAVNQKIDEQNKLLKDANVEKLIKLGSIFSDIGSKIGEANSQLGGMISEVGTAVSQIGQIEKLANAFNNAADGIAKSKAQSDLIAAAINGVVQLSTTIISASEQRKASAIAYYNAVLSSQNQYNLSLNEEIRLRTELNSNGFTKDYKNEILDGTLALTDANKKYQQSLADLVKGQAKLGQRNTVDPKTLIGGVGSGAIAGAAIGTIIPGIGTLIGGVVGGVVGLISGLFSKKKQDVFGSLLAEYPELIKANGDFNDALAQTLIQNSLVDDKTKILLQNTIALAKARADALEQINGVISDLAGNLGDDLRTSLVDAFKSGTDAAQAFGDSVSKVIENIISQFVFQDVFGDQFDKLKDEMKDSFDVGGDQNFVDDITRFYQQAGPLIDEFNKALSSANTEGAKFGLDVFGKTGNTSTTSSSNTLVGQSKSLTEDTGNLLMGQFGGLRLAQLETNEILKANGMTGAQTMAIAYDNLQVAIKTEANTRRTADNTEALADMKKSLSEINKKMDNNVNSLAATGRG